MDSKAEQKIFTAASVLADLAVINLSFIIAYWLRFNFFPAPFGVPSVMPYINALWVVSLVYLAVFRKFGLYKPRRGSLSVADGFYSTFVASSVDIIILVAVTFFYRDFEYSRLVIIIAWFVGSVFLGVTRAVAGKMEDYLRSRGVGSLPVIIAGAGKTAGFIEEKIRNHPGLGYKVAGFLAENESEKDGENILGSLRDLERACREKNADTVLIALSESNHETVMDLVKRCYSAGVNFRIVSDLFEIVTGRIIVESIDGVPVFGLEKEGLKSWEMLLKRSVDVLLSVVMIIITLPLFIIIPALVKLTSPGPVFFRQERTGQNGRLFNILKFRSMRVDAEDETGPVWAKGDDERRTGLGRWLRRFSIDELPQLFCVLKGDMSIIGPRPERAVFVERFRKDIPRYDQRHAVKPGITGYSQVSGFRGDTSIEQRVRHDLYYIDNWSLFFDFKILAKTAFEFVFHKDAY